MKFDVERAVNPNIKSYAQEERDIAFKFSKKAVKEFGNFIKSIVIFGSAVKGKDVSGKEAGDIDLLLVIDDITINLTEPVVHSYRIMIQKIIAEVSKRLHITSMRLTSFWEYVKAGDPVAINILRDGVAIIDSGFFEPLQALLRQGRIRPTSESVWSYFTRAPATLHNSKWHIMQATLDLYWAVIDAAHAALMRLKQIPPSPIHVADMLDEQMVKKKLLDKKYVDTMRKFYNLSKMITHREIKEIKGDEYEGYFKEAREFVDAIKAFIEKHPEQV